MGKLKFSSTLLNKTPFATSSLPPPSSQRTSIDSILFRGGLTIPNTIYFPSVLKSYLQKVLILLLLLLNISSTSKYIEGLDIPHKNLSTMHTALINKIAHVATVII